MQTHKIYPMQQRKNDAIKVLLVDDHAFLRTGINAILSSTRHIRIVGEAPNTISAGHLKIHLPDIVLIGITEPYANGRKATMHIRKSLPQTKIIILAYGDDENYILASTRLDAEGYILNNSTSDELIQAIEAVHNGKTFFSSEIIQVILDTYLRNSGNGRYQNPETASLSKREQQVLSLIANGYSYKKIGHKLFVSPRTIEKHREHIMKKLNIRTTAGLIKFSLTRGVSENTATH